MKDHDWLKQAALPSDIEMLASCTLPNDSYVYDDLCCCLCSDWLWTGQRVVFNAISRVVIVLPI